MPMIGIEPTTYGLQNRCSTVEPHRQVTISIILIKKDMSRGYSLETLKRYFNPLNSLDIWE